MLHIVAGCCTQVTVMMLGLFVSGKTERHWRRVSSDVIGQWCHVVSWRHRVLLHYTAIDHAAMSRPESV